jgi:hypothetical protein
MESGISKTESEAIAKASNNELEKALYLISEKINPPKVNSKNHLSFHSI